MPSGAPLFGMERLVIKSRGGKNRESNTGVRADVRDEGRDTEPPAKHPARPHEPYGMNERKVASGLPICHAGKEGPAVI